MIRMNLHELVVVKDELSLPLSVHRGTSKCRRRRCGLSSPQPIITSTRIQCLAAIKE